MSTLIIVTGFLATLKTTISLKLSKDLGMVCLNKDTIKEILVDTIGYKSRQDNLKLSNATFQLMKKQAEDHLMLDQNIIIEANFKPHELKALKESIDVHQFNIITCFLHADVQSLYNRYKNRQSQRHAAHQSTGLISFDMFKSSMGDYKIEDCFGRVIDVDTTTFDDQNYQILLNQIKQII